MLFLCGGYERPRPVMKTLRYEVAGLKCLRRINPAWEMQRRGAKAAVLKPLRFRGGSDGLQGAARALVLGGALLFQGGKVFE